MLGETERGAPAGRLGEGPQWSGGCSEGPTSQRTPVVALVALRLLSFVRVKSGGEMGRCSFVGLARFSQPSELMEEHTAA
jgi:hypothetical protein